MNVVVQSVYLKGKKIMGCVSPQDHKEYKSQSQKQKPIERRSSLTVQNSKYANQNLQRQFIIVLDQLLKTIKKKLKLGNTPTSDLIFRASNHKFRSSAFHKVCHNISNTIFIGLADNKRIFGGFTPCSWKEGQVYSYEADSSITSFLFSVQNQKIEIHQIKDGFREYAIMNDDQFGPIFGDGHDIIIKDQCNQTFNWCNLGRTYNTKYLYGSKKSNQQLTGKQKFLIRDYEIWQVHV